MTIISDTSCIVNLAVINQLFLLRKLFGHIIIPQTVYDEVVKKGAGQAGAKDVKNAKWISVKSHKDDTIYKKLILTLDEGEAEAITLAIELEADLLIIDEEKGRKAAAQYHIQYTGLLGILIMAKSRKLISSVKPLLDELKNNAGFWVSESIYNEVIKLAGE